ncbi:MAG TPA: hypothetical protein VHI31_06295 [Actinomycetota bacterium]|nr:hypothetical protein [Actinomycetota bacterium]
MPNTDVEELAKSLLYEGYALYPYTQNNAKNSTPTPFGIVYPPKYAERLATTYDHLQIQCVLEYQPDATLEGIVMFLVPSGQDYRAGEHRVTIDYTPVEFFVKEPAVVPFAVGDATVGEIRGTVRMSVDVLSPGSARITLRVDNETQVPSDLVGELDRGRALLYSLISVHPMLRVRGGRFVSPLENKDPRVSECKNLNSWPVLATEEDDAVLGAAIMLPEHPQIAPESKVNFFDNTEIEEALVLHAQTLSDEMLAEIEQQEPAVKEMIARARQVSSEDLLKMHGRLEMREPGNELLASTPNEPFVSMPLDPFADRFKGRTQETPPVAPGGYDNFPEFQTIPPEYQGLMPGEDPISATAPVAPKGNTGLAPMSYGTFEGAHQATPLSAPMGYEDTPGLMEIQAEDGRVFHVGDTVLLKLLQKKRQDAIDHMLNGKTATIERILTDYDGTIHFGVTIDGDPGQELLRETNRFMFFFLDEVEVVPR